MNKYILNTVTASILLLTIQGAMAANQTFNFDNVGDVYSQNVKVLDVVETSATLHVVVADDRVTDAASNAPVNGANGLAFGAANFYETSVTFSLLNNESFNISSLVLTDNNGESSILKFTSSKGSVDISLAGFEYPTTTTPDLSGNTNFQGITWFTITPGAGDGDNQFGISVDDLVLTNIQGANATPVNTLPSSPAVNEDDTNVAIANDIAIADGDTDNQTVTLTMTGGTASITTVAATITTGIDGTDETSFVFNGTLADVNTTLDSLTFTPTANLNGTNAGSIQIQTNDGNGGTDDDTVSFNITAVNDDPTETGTFPTDIVIIEDVAGNFDLSGLTLADVDSAGSSLIMTATASAGTLDATTGGGVTIGGSGTGTMTLTGTIANIDTFINTATNIKYTGASNVNGDDVATVAIRINDGGNTGTGGGGDIALGTINMDISVVNDTPIDIALTAASLNQSVTSAGADIGTLSSTDVDSGGFTYSLVANAISDTGTCGAGNDVNNGSFQVNTTTFETSGSIAAGSYKVCLQTSDSNTSFQETFTITVVDDIAPVISETTAVTTPTGDTTPNVTFTTNETGTITLGGSCGISSSKTIGSTGNNTITLTDTDDSSALASATFSDCTITLNDGVNNSNTITLTSFTVDADTPLVNNNTYNGTEDTAVDLVTAGMAGTQETAGVDALNYYTITGISGGTLAISAGASVTAVDASTPTVNVVGVVDVSDKINPADIAKVTFTPTLNSTAAGSVTYTVTDFGANGPDASATGSLTINLAAVNDDPTGVSEPASISYIEETVDDFDISTIAIDDVDSASLAVVLTAGSGTLAASNGGSVTVANSGSSAITLTGAPVNIDTYLNTASNIQYTPATDVAGTPATTVVITASDGDGANNINLATINMDISNVNDEPTITGTNDTATLAGGGGTAIVFSSTDIAINVTAKDANDLINSVALTVTNVTDAEVLKIDGSGNIDLKTSVGSTDLNNIAYSIVYSGTTSTITFTGVGASTMTQAVINTALNGMTYENTTAASTEADRVFVINQIVDNGLTGGSHDNTWSTANVFSTITVVDASKPTASNYTDSTTEDVAITVFSNTEFPTAVDTATSDPIEYISIITGNITGGVLSLTGSPTGGTSTVGGIIFDTATGDLTGTVNIAIGDIGDLVFTPTTDLAGTGAASIMWTVTDDAGHTSPTAIYTLDITNTSDTPLGSDKTITLLTSATHTFAASDFGFIDVDTGDTLNRVRIDVQALTSGTLKLSSVTVNDADWITLADIGNLVYAPTAAGSDTFTFTVEDNSDNSTDVTPNTITFTVTAPVVVVPPIVVIPPANTPPTIGGSAASTIEVDKAYNFTPSASDADAGDTLIFSISGKPSWATFDSSTGTLSGIPSKSDVGSSSITITVTDSSGADNANASLVFVLTVTAKANVAPVANKVSATVEEDGETSISLSATDTDKDPLTLVVVNQPSNGSLVASTQANIWVYTPNENYNGSDSFTYKANDGTVDSATVTANITITPINDKPVAVDDELTQIFNDKGNYTLDVLGNDTDVDNDTLTIINASVDIGNVSVESGQLLYQAGAIQGNAILSYVISDGVETAKANVTLTIDDIPKEGLPVITLPADIEVDAIGLYTKVNLGVATAVDSTGMALPVSLIDDITVFPPGNNIAYWQAVDANGSVSIAMQKVVVRPLITLGKDEQSVEGTSHSVGVYLNGTSPSYPVTIAYTVGGTMNESDHDLISGEVSIEQGNSTTINFNVLDDNIVEENETLTISLSNGVTYTLEVSEQNLAPTISYHVTQDGEERSLIEIGGGDIVITTQIKDGNPVDTHTYQWTSTLIDTDSDESSFTVDSTSLLAGIQTIDVSVTDSAEVPATTTVNIYLDVREALPTLSGVDTDGDLIPDAEEGLSDADSDGIPDYLDVVSACNVMPGQASHSNVFLVEGEAGVCLRKGSTVPNNKTGGIELIVDEVVPDTQATNSGGLFDFIAYGLPKAGQTYSLVLPQRLPVPANAIYRKYTASKGWFEFVVDENNNYSSTLGDMGYCPAPNDSSWTSGLTEGHWCVKITINDGGPNDDDGEVNSTIVDPGGVAVWISENSLPDAQNDSTQTALNTAVTIDVLANDNDADNDTLTINSASADFGVINIVNEQLIYTPPTNFFGVATINYGISDNNGGTGHAQVTINVIENQAPIANNDLANTNDRTAITINVLANDSDGNDDHLTITSVNAEHGSVTITATNLISYTPVVGFDGLDTLTYTIDDGHNGQAQGEVSVTVNAYEIITVTNKSSGGGSMGYLVLLAGSLLLMRRNKKTKQIRQRAALLLSLGLLSFNSQANWHLDATLGQAKAKDTNISLQSGTITDVEDSDTSWSLGGGYAFDNGLDLSAHYLDMGEGSAEISAESLTPEQYHQAVSTLSPVLVSGVAVEVGYQFLQAQNFGSSLFVGILAWEGDISSTYNGQTLITEQDGSDIYYGVKGTYQLTSQWQLGLGFKRYNLAPNKVDNVYLSVNYQF